MSHSNLSISKNHSHDVYGSSTLKAILCAQFSLDKFWYTKWKQLNTIGKSWDSTKSISCFLRASASSFRSSPFQFRMNCRKACLMMKVESEEFYLNDNKAIKQFSYRRKHTRVERWECRRSFMQGGAKNWWKFFHSFCNLRNRMKKIIFGKNFPHHLTRHVRGFDWIFSFSS